MKGELQSFYYASMYVKYKEEEFVRLELIEPGKIPSNDTFRRIFGHLDANGLRDAFLDRIREFLERLVKLDAQTRGKKKILSGDGKTFNGSGRGEEKNLNVFNIYSASSAVCLSSVPLTDKESEIPEFQRMLPKFDLRNTVVTADALHCQRKTSEIILALKLARISSASTERCTFHAGCVSTHEIFLGLHDVPWHTATVDSVSVYNTYTALFKKQNLYHAYQQKLHSEGTFFAYPL